MSDTAGHGHASPLWFIAPGETDVLAWVALGFLALAIYGVVTLYAAFDRWAEHKSQGTPLAKTIPTMLTIALLYEIFPLGHFNILLPVSAILIALMADWSRFNRYAGHAVEPQPVATAGETVSAGTEEMVPDAPDRRADGKSAIAGGTSSRPQGEAKNV